MAFKPCPVCKGTGKLHTALPVPSVVICLTCKGTGKVERNVVQSKRKVPFLLQIWKGIAERKQKQQPREPDNE